MKAKEICTLEISTISKRDSVLAAAQKMEYHNVGSLVVVEKSELGKIPIGMITDRDIALGANSTDILPSKITVESLMSEFLLTVNQEEDIHEVLNKMRKDIVRRVPVVDDEGYLYGILSIDDILTFLVEELKDVIAIFDKEQPVLWF